MNCKRIEELLLTDYIDGELSPLQKGEVDDHLKSCHRCSAFLQAARNAAVEPFTNAQRLSPPDSLWLDIKGSIEAQNHRVSVWHRLADYIRSFVVIPYSAIAMTILAAFLTVGTFTGLHQYRQASVKEAGEYLESLTEISDLSFNPGSGFNTEVEQYFL